MITKPLITSGINATLDMKFVVKSVVSLDRLHATGFADEAGPNPDRDALVAEFAESFSRSPKDACKRLVDRNKWRDGHVSLAAVIFKTPELDKSKIGALLANDEMLMRSFIDNFHFRGVQIIDALRMFLLAVRLPGDASAAERLLRGVAYRYHDANKHQVAFERELTAELVLAIMHLNDAMYGGRFGFAMQNTALRPDIFVASWRSKDPNGLVEEDSLLDIYSSLKRNQLAQALAPNEIHRARELEIRPAKFPSKLTYGVWSEPITICIPSPDQNFGIQLLGEGLEFDPPVLEFLVRNQSKFRVRGTSLGMKSVLFGRIGDNA